MHILVFGANGQVGTDCCSKLLESGYRVAGLSRSEVDFALSDAVIACVDSMKPDFVVNACAYTAVDKAEVEPELASQINHQSVAALARTCHRLNIPLLHLSTDYVFNGRANSPYVEDDAVSPLGVYGQTKLAGEQVIQSLMQKYIILRTSWVFGEHGNNFVKTMLRVGAQREQLTVVDDQIGRPTYVGDIVSTILTFVDRFSLLKNLPWGVYHCSSSGQTNWYEFAKKIFSLAEEKGVLIQQPKVKPIPSSEFPTRAPRPAYSVLSTEKLEAFLGSPLPHWQEGLVHFLKNTSDSFSQMQENTL